MGSIGPAFSSTVSELGSLLVSTDDVVLAMGPGRQYQTWHARLEGHDDKSQTSDAIEVRMKKPLDLEGGI